MATTDSSVSWASSTPFDVPAYAVGDWGDFVVDVDSLRFSPDRADAKVLSVAEQRQFFSQYQGYKRFYAAAEYESLMERLNHARGWF